MLDKLIDAGIDYLRVTSNDNFRWSKMYGYYLAVAMADSRLGFSACSAGMFGFVGEKARHAFWGTKQDWQLVQVSGRAAKNGLRMAMSGIQCSRLDIQVTFRVRDATVAEEIRSVYEKACAMPHPGHRPPDVKLIEHRHKAQTVYIGSRASDIYLRVYDKYEESKDQEYKGCIRFEVELKGRASKAAWKKVSTEGLGTGFLVKLLVDIFKARGIELKISDFDHLPSLTIARERTSLEGTVAWMNRQVAPVVKRLALEYTYMMPFALLFRDALREKRFARIMSSMAQMWGT